MDEFFTKEEMKQVADALKSVTGAGIMVDSYSTKDDQRKTFFDKAKLWRVIEQVISVLYIDRLASGKMFLHNTRGECYKVVKE